MIVLDEPRPAQSAVNGYFAKRPRVKDSRRKTRQWSGNEGVGSAVGAAGAAATGVAWSAGDCGSAAGVFCAVDNEAKPQQRAIAARFFTRNFITLLLLWQLKASSAAG